MSDADKGWRTQRVKLVSLLKFVVIHLGWIGHYGIYHSLREEVDTVSTQKSLSRCFRRKHLGSYTLSCLQGAKIRFQCATVIYKRNKVMVCLKVVYGAQTLKCLGTYGLL